MKLPLLWYLGPKNICEPDLPNTFSYTRVSGLTYGADLVEVRA